MGDIVNALIDAGLAIEWLHEFPFCAWKVVAGCEVEERSGAGQVYYRRPASETQLPLMFSIRARAQDDPDERQRQPRSSKRPF